MWAKSGCPDNICADDPQADMTQPSQNGDDQAEAYSIKAKVKRTL